MQIWPRNTETERSSVNHIVDMINIVMFTTRNMSTCDLLSVTLEELVVNLRPFETNWSKAVFGPINVRTSWLMCPIRAFYHASNEYEAPRRFYIRPLAR